MPKHRVSGRQGIFEILTMTDSLRALVRPGVQNQELRQAALAAGMQPLRFAGANKIANARTTFDEVIAVAPPLETSAI